MQEGRSREVDDWVGQLLETISDDLKRKAEELVEEARQKNKVSRGDVRKRSREENVFDGGWEKGQFDFSANPLPSNSKLT